MAARGWRTRPFYFFLLPSYFLLHSSLFIITYSILLLYFRIFPIAITVKKSIGRNSLSLFDQPITGSVIETLVYADIFRYPLTSKEVFLNLTSNDADEKNG